jgi:flavin reductase (DIM6/NTAB) family NADH-FMN oxidoreductase RutF
MMLEYNCEKNPTQALIGAFRRHASGVAVITTNDAAGHPVGFTATSMTSLGANPPLIMFSVARGSSSWASVEAAEYIAIHTLGERNLDLAQRMAADHTQRFTPSDWERGPHNMPVFPGATAVMIAKIRDVLNIEANAVVIADVVDGALGQEDAGLLYHQRGYAIPGTKLTEPKSN